VTEQDYYLGFSVFPGVGAVRFQLLLSSFGSAKTSWTATEKELRVVLKNKVTEEFLKFRETFDITSYKRILLEKGVSFVTLDEAEYPQKLKDLKKPPFVLYVKGNKKILNHPSTLLRVKVQDDTTNGHPGAQAIGSQKDSISPSGFQNDNEYNPSTPLRFAQGRNYIGIVGTRKVTSYGRQITETFTRELVDQGFIVVSGLALGVDAISHQTTVDAGGKTIAVLGCGVDCCYPSSNQELYNQILETNGAIISEYPLSANPNKGSFPSRNRIIAALSQGLLVTEGAEDSGSLITAGIALDLGRTVFAVPGPVTSSLSRGPLKLIRKGAKLVTSGEEMLEELGIGTEGQGDKAKKEIKGETEEEQRIIDCLINEDLGFDEIVKKTNIAASTLGGILSMMEVKGIVCFTNNAYALKHTF